MTQYGGDCCFHVLAERSPRCRSQKAQHVYNFAVAGQEIMRWRWRSGVCSGCWRGAAVTCRLREALPCTPKHSASACSAHSTNSRSVGTLYVSLHRRAVVIRHAFARRGRFNMNTLSATPKYTARRRAPAVDSKRRSTAIREHSSSYAQIRTVASCQGLLMGAVSKCWAQAGNKQVVQR